MLLIQKKKQIDTGCTHIYRKDNKIYNKRGLLGLGRHSATGKADQRGQRSATLRFPQVTLKNPSRREGRTARDEALDNQKEIDELNIFIFISVEIISIELTSVVKKSRKSKE